MRIGIRKSPHLHEFAETILRSGDTFTSTYDTGADFYLAWGWPQAQQVALDNSGRVGVIICVDAHPFALKAGDTSGDRIIQLGNWGALAAYPPGMASIETPVYRSTLDGPVLVLGQVYTAEQQRLGLVDTWHTGGYEEWQKAEMAKPGRRYRKHPRIWARENEGELQPSLADDLEGCSEVVSWNSTAAIHARMLGYPATAYEAHGWAHLSLSRLAALRTSPEALRSGQAWHDYRRWLLTHARQRLGGNTK